MESQLNYPPLNDQMYINEPDRLEDICVKVLVENKERCLFQIQITEESKLEIRCGIYLPALVADQLFNKLLKLSDCYCVSGPCPETNVFRGFDSTTLNIVELLQSFSNTQKCCLNNVQFNAQTQLNSEVLGRLCSTQNIQNIQISNSTVTPEPSLLQHLLHEKTHSLTLDNISYCESSIIEPTCISRESHPKLRHLKFRDGEIPAYSCFVNADSPPHLVAVELSNFYEKGASHNVDLKRRVSKIRDLLEVNKAGSGDAVQGKQLTATVQGVLRRYVETVDKLEAPQTVNEEKLLLHSCSLLLMQYRLESMRETLCSLVLCNTLFTGSDLSTIFQLKKLRHLDISMLPPMRGENKRRPETTVYKVMEELPALVSLDVGGTKIGDHLYRDGRVKETTGDRYLKETPPRKLEFLGLYNCEGCELMDIYSLADTIVGYTGEVQLLASLTYYMNRATPLMYIVGQARQLQTVHNLSCPQRLTTLLLKVLQSHRRNRRIIEEVTANLFYLSSTYYTTCSKQQKNDIITELIISIETCQDMKYVVRNSLVSLFHFDIPGDVIFAFVKISKVILNTLLKYHEDDDIGRHAIHFCNALVCSVQFDMKREASKVGFVPIIVKIIQMRLEANMHDEILEVLWGTLWNVTDETPENSWTFINLGGLQLLQDCFAKFPDEPELHKSIMGLVGNIAEVKEIQPLLVNSTLIQLFCELISKESPNIEIAYNACGTLSHLMSEGFWTIDQPKQEDVISIMTTAIDSWEIDSNRNINYRSFIPILNLVESEVPVCIHWAVWAFRNLCGQDDRYIKMLLKENGREVLSQVENKNVGEKTKEMTRWLLQKLESYSQDLNNQYHLHSL